MKLCATRTSAKKMEKNQNKAAIEKKLEAGKKFDSWREALSAATEIVAAASEQNATVTLRANRNFGEVEVLVYCSPSFRIAELAGARFTEKKLESHEFFSETLREVLRVRTLEFFFKTN